MGFVAGAAQRIGGQHDAEAVIHGGHDGGQDANISFSVCDNQSLDPRPRNAGARREFEKGE